MLIWKTLKEKDRLKVIPKQTVLASNAFENMSFTLSDLTPSLEALPEETLREETVSTVDLPD